MKKILTTITLSVLLLSMLVSCAPKAVAPDTAPAAEEKLAAYGIFAAVTVEAWDSVIHTAMNKAQDEGKLTYEFSEDLGYSGDLERVMREVADSGKYDLIIGDAFGNEEAVRRVAADYPEIAFVFGSALGPAEPNFSVFDNWIQEPAYLLGMLAGGLTKTGTVGVVGGYPVAEVNRLINAFIAGARESNPDVKVLVSFINSWFDPAAAKEAALALVDSGADVLYAERQGVIEAAVEKDVWVFGNMVDQNELAPDKVVSSAVWTLTPTVEYLISQINSGAYTAMDLKDFCMFAKGGASLAPFHNTESQLPADLVAAVKAKEEAIRAGLFRVDISEAQPAAVN